MTSISEEERRFLRVRLQQANYNGKANSCNWCGKKKEKYLSVKNSNVLISDVPHTIYKCSDCGELTAKYNWSGPTWRAAVQSDKTEGPPYTLVAGKP